MAELHRQSSKEKQKSTDIPFIEIIEQPDSVRYRYVCEGRTAGSILGVNSSNDNKTYPTIKINGYKGKVVIIVSCVTKDKPYRPHPCRLVGGEFCKDGIFKTEINNESMTLSLQHVGIQCVKRSSVDEVLREREKRRVDPFKTGYSHRDFDYNTVKLCFQAIIKGPQAGQVYQLDPVVSDNIPDKKMMTGLMIYRLSPASAISTGNTEMILLCDKVIKDDIEIVFFETMNGKRIWECLADFNPSDVHKQMAICFRTPTYYKPNIEYPVYVNIQLRRPSDGKCGECYPFILTPDNSDFIRIKRNKTFSDNPFKYLPSNPETISSSSGGCSPNDCPLSPVHKKAAPLQSTCQLLTNETNSNTFCEQTTVKVQPTTDQQPNIPERLQTQFNTIPSENILDFGSSFDEVIQWSSNNSIYNQLSPTYSYLCTNLPMQNQSLNNNHNIYGQEDINFQQNIDGPSTSTCASSVVSQMLPASPGISSEIAALFTTNSIENNQSTNNMDSLSNIDPDELLGDVENLSAELSASLFI